MNETKLPEEENLLLLKQANLFGKVVSRSYLSELANFEIIKLGESIKHTSIRWYAVTKIILEKDTFFPDKLSMLYMSLHNVAKNVILVVNKNAKGKIEIYLGARDFQGISNVSGDILEAGLHGYLAGIKTRQWSKMIMPGNIYVKPAVSSVSGLASLRDDKKENFVQGIDKLINATAQIPMFTAYFVADNVSDEEAAHMIAAFNDLHSHLSPLAETQMTISESKSIGTSMAIAENFSKSISKSLSHTITNSEGFNEGMTKTQGKSGGFSTNNSTNILRSQWSGIFGGTTGTGTNKGWTASDAFQSGHSSQKAIADQTGETNTETQGGGKTKTDNESITTGETRQVTFKNSQVKLYLDVLEEEIKRIRTGVPFGLWSTSSYFVAEDSSTAEMLANLYRGCIVGEESSTESYGINVWGRTTDANHLLEYLHKGLSPRFNYNGISVSAGSVVTSKELAIHLSLPQTSVPGILVREEQSFGRNIVTEETLTEDNTINIGVVKHLGEEYLDEQISLSINGLSKHTFITGTTGSGKSNTLYLLLSKLISKNIKFLVIEPAKGEYKEVFGSLPSVAVYGSNPHISDLLCINPFEFPDEIDVYEHIDSLVEIFNACWPMYAAMPQVLKHSIIEAYKSCGWNLAESYNPNGIYPTIADVLECLKDYINSSEYSADTKGDYKGSLETRLQSLSEGMAGRMLNGKSIQDEQLFNSNVIVDLSRIKSSETQSLLMGLLVMKLNEFRMSEHKGMNQQLRHVTVIEEAHHLLKRTSTSQLAESSNVAGMAVEKIANSMAEMRTYGEGFIIADQSPSMLDLAAIRNTNTKIIMALPEKEDREEAGKAVGLDEKHIAEISRLKTGEAIVYQTGWEEAVKSKIEHYRIKSKPWQYISPRPKELTVSQIQSGIFEMLFDSYTSGDDINLQRLMDGLSDSGISGGRLRKIKEKINAITSLTNDDVAYIFTTIIGTEVFDAAKGITDIDVFNTRISKELRAKLGSVDNYKVKTFLNMYVKGCSAIADKSFYEGWLQTTIENS